ncbi:hypothetical protein GGI24_000954 [Coemansia furcata]|nr:hypothetical protein GGI24_000954 [Coemansia furcata]
MSAFDGYEGRSRNLGIVLNNSHGKSGYKPAEAYEQREAGGAIYSFFHKVTSGITTFMTTEIDEPSYSKTQLEDILESYYLSQGRPVPDWVYHPPADPPARDTDVVINQVPAYKPASTRLSVKESESETEPSKTKHSSSTSGALRSFGRLNISRLTRTTQFTLGPNSSSTSTAICPVPEDRQSAHDSGFDSPVSPTDSVPPIDVHIVDSGNTSPGSMQESGMSSEESPGLDATPNFVQRSLTLDRWRRKDKPISLASLMPSDKDEPRSADMANNPGFGSPDARGRPPLTSSTSDPFQKASLRSMFSVRLGHRAESSTEAKPRAKHAIPGKVMKRLFRRRSSSSHE